MNEGVRSEGIKQEGSITYTGETFANYYRFGYFDLILKRKVLSSCGVTSHTEIINQEPMTFEQATEWLQGLLKPLGQGVPGFQSVLDASIRPQCDFRFVSDEARDKWLLDAAEHGFGKRVTLNTLFPTTEEREAGKMWLDDTIQRLESRMGQPRRETTLNDFPCDIFSMGGAE